MKFKVGDTVVCIDDTCSRLNGGDFYTIVDSAFGGDFLKVEGFNTFFDCDRFKKATPDLETELRLCESRKGILSERIGKDQEEKKSLEKRIQELQQAIKERDKPKGMIKVGDKIPLQSFLVCASGDVRPHLKNSWSSANVAMGNLFYDKESAERAVHDRKQRVLRGEDV